MATDDMEHETGRLFHEIKRQSQKVACLKSRMTRFQRELFDVFKALDSPVSIEDRPKAERPGFVLDFQDRVEPLPYPTREEIAEAVAEYRPAQSQLGTLKTDLENH